MTNWNPTKHYTKEELKHEQQEAGIYINSLPKDAVLFTILRHVSASGMRRVISVVYFDPKVGPVFLDRVAAVLTGSVIHGKHDGVIVGGCGMDMGFHLVSSMCEAVGRDYKTIKQRWL